jgi:diguanylate cyclase (GGDEF)-like protein
VGDDRQRRGRRFSALPRRAAVFIVAVDVLAVGLTILLTSVGHAPTRRAVMTFVVLVGLGVLAAEITRGIERVRRRLSSTPHLDLSSVWTLPGALLLPAPLAAATVVALYLHLWWRSWRRLPNAAGYRVVYNVCVVVLCCDTAAAVAAWSPLGFSLSPTTRPLAAVGIAAVIVCYSAVNLGLAAGALLLLGDGHSLRSVLGTWSETCVEATTLCLGMITAALLFGHPALLILLPLPLYVLHRSVQVGQLEEAVSTDRVSGALNSATWRSLTDRELARAQRLGQRVGMLKIELDHQARLVERGGPAMGERCVRAVADTIRRQIRSDDLCGRVERGEFVVALPDTDLAAATRVAHRIHQAVRGIRVQTDLHDTAALHDTAGETDGEAPIQVTVSIGVADYPDAGQVLDMVLRVTDNALFGALFAGRDQVCAAQLGSASPPDPDISGAELRVGESGIDGPTVRSA